MISVCIPIYNFDISQLLDELSKQSNQTVVPIEIILIDDCSSEEFKRINESNCKKHTYVELEQNVGRAKIRNLFPNYTQYENLLFLDCDSKIISKDFLSNYLEVLKKESVSVICNDF